LDGRELFHRRLQVEDSRIGVHLHGQPHIGVA
jgi:hypothetical protein